MFTVFFYKPLGAWQLSYSREIEAEQEPRLLTYREKEKRKIEEAALFY